MHKSHRWRDSWECCWRWGSLSCVSPGAANLQADLTLGIQPSLGRTNPRPAWCRYLRARSALLGPKATIAGKWPELPPRGFSPPNVLVPRKNGFLFWEHFFHSPWVLTLCTHYLPILLKFLMWVQIIFRPSARWLWSKGRIISSTGYLKY